MSQQITRQIALMTIFATCILVVALVVGFGLGANADAALGQAAPLAIVCGIALTVLLVEPSRTRR